jgi:rubrerythrin
MFALFCLEMRLERIRAIASDCDAPEDIRAVFQRILPQEEFHARAFRKMTSEDVYQNTTDAHELGRIALGLTP